jgi:hypothetical protein
VPRPLAAAGALLVAGALTAAAADAVVNGFRMHA